MTSESSGKTKAPADGRNERFLRFALGQEYYAIPLLTVREAIAMPPVTPVPYAAPHFLGIMNLRGQVISVFDLRIKLGIKPTTSAETSVIICDFDGMAIGVVVDSISSVIAPAAADISDKPEMQTRNSQFIQKVFRLGALLTLSIDLRSALGLEDLASAKAASAPPAAA